jgi:hypothetical protein
MCPWIYRVPTGTRSKMALGGDIPDRPLERWRTVAALEMLPAVQFELLLPRTNFLAGEALSPRIRATNQSEGPVVLVAPRIVSKTDAKRVWDFAPGDWPVSRPGPHPFVLEPGGSSTWSNAIQLPFEAPATELPLVQLQAVVRSPSPGPAVGNMATWPTYRTPPVDLTLGRAGATQQLRVLWEATGQQVSVQVTDANGARVEGVPLVAWMFATGGGKTLGRLNGEASRGWAASLPPHVFARNADVKVRIWIAGPGYATGLAEAQIGVPVVMAAKTTDMDWTDPTGLGSLAAAARL